DEVAAHGTGIAHRADEAELGERLPLVRREEVYGLEAEVRGGAAEVAERDARERPAADRLAQAAGACGKRAGRALGDVVCAAAVVRRERAGRCRGAGCERAERGSGVAQHAAARDRVAS